VARIYGYHNLPSKLMTGDIPLGLPNSPFKFEYKIKEILKGLGGVEVYNLSLTDHGQIKLKNPLGVDTAYLRDSLRPSLIRAADFNLGEKSPFHIFEMANIYLPRPNDLPNEEMRLAGIFSMTDFRHAKGVVESLLQELNVNFKSKVEYETLVYEDLGKLEVIGENYIYYDFSVSGLSKLSKPNKKYNPVSKYPAQVEDLTFILQTKTYVGDFIHYLHSESNQVVNVELIDVFENSYTFRIWYQDANKTLTDSEVEKIRNKIIESVKDKFGGIFKG
jgi:phenylalanyl-tRNA synthetase beta chain